MPDFSEKYKKALDIPEISPDFKERTERLMIELRDSGTQKMNISRRANKRIGRTLSAAAAAAACFAAVIALNRTGFFDSSGSEDGISEISSASVTEVTDVISETSITAPAASEKPDGMADEAMIRSNHAAYAETTGAAASTASIEVSAHNTDAANDSENTVPAEYDQTAVPETSYNAETEAAPINETEAPGLSEEGMVNISSRIDTAHMPASEPVSGSASEAAAESQPVVTDTAPDKTAATIPAGMGENNHSGFDSIFPLETAEYAPPSSNGTGEENESEEETVHIDPQTSVSEQTVFPETLPVTAEAQTDIPIVSEAGLAEKFSLSRVFDPYDERNAYAVITRYYTDYNAEDGTAYSYEPEKITGAKSMKKFIGEIRSFISEAKPVFVTELPSDSNYIIDFDDTKGKSMRIYTGSRYICFALYGEEEVSLYRYELDEDGFNKLETLLFTYLQ